MRKLLISIIISISLIGIAADAPILLFGDSFADISIYLNTASMEKKLDKQLYQQMMAAAQAARMNGGKGFRLPVTFTGRDWECVANVRILPGKFTFNVDGVGNVTGGFKNDIESLARVFGDKWLVTKYDLQGVSAKRFVLSEETAQAQENGNADDGKAMPLEESLRSMDILLAPLSGERFQFNGAFNAPLSIDVVTLATPGKNNIFVHDDSILSIYFNVQRLMSLLSSAKASAELEMLKGFLGLLSSAVVSFQPDGRDLVVNVRLNFISEESAEAMKASMERNSQAIMQNMSSLGKFRKSSCVVNGKCCDISGRLDIMEGAANLERLMSK